MRAQTFKIQHTHPSMAGTDSIALLALEKCGRPLKRVNLARLWAILLEPLPLPIPKQLHHVILGAPDPLLQLVANARGDRVALQILLEVLGRISALKRVQDRQGAEDLQIWEDGGIVVLVVVFYVTASGG